MYWQQLQPGLHLVSPEREITGEHIDGFVGSTGLDLAMFTSEEAARAEGHPKRVVPGLMVLSVAMGLVQRTGLFDHVVAVLGFEDMRLLALDLFGRPGQCHGQGAQRGARQHGARPGGA